MKALGARFFATCWIVLTLHFATNFVREHYPALALAERGALTVDEYVGLHDDIFVAPSGSAYINNSPAVSVLAAVPLLVFRPALDLAEGIAKRRVAESAGAVSAVYHDHRPKRLRFYREIRQRGWDLKFGLVSLLTVAFFMAPLTALAGVLMLWVLRRLGMPDGRALLYAFLFVLGTPLFFRTGYLNQNLVLGHAVFVAFVLLWCPGGRPSRPAGWRLAAAGALAALAVAFDYSGIVPLFFLAAYSMGRSRVALLEDESPSRHQPAWSRRLRALALFSVGAAGPLAALGLYQWLAFGNPLTPAQSLMPPTQYSVIGWHGLTWPEVDLVLDNLFDPSFGLFAFAPILLLAIPGLRLTPRGWLSRGEKLWIVGFALSFLAFCSANQFARLQWNTGVRYLLPLVPFLFLPTVAVLARLHPLVRHVLVVLAFAHAWALAMVRESVPESLFRVLVEGFQLPWLTVLGKTASQYAPFLEGRPSPLPLFALTAALIYGIWRIAPRGGQAPPERSRDRFTADVTHERPGRAAVESGDGEPLTSLTDR